MRVAAGAIARKWLQERYGVTIRGWMSAAGADRDSFVAEADIDSNAFCPQCRHRPQLETYMDDLRRGAGFGWRPITVVGCGVPPGWGEPVS